MLITRSLMPLGLLTLVFAMWMPIDETTSVPSDQRVELGKVNWNRDFDKAQGLSKQTGKPMFVLFQEIPGCQTCQNFGKAPLSHPLVVEAIEELFVPVVVYNNRKGIDAELLTRFSEPSWNNPIVRYLDGNAQDLIPRESEIWSTPATTERMVAALQKAKRTVPKYLADLDDALNVPTQQATFAMHCYWEGEALLGGIDGVYSTRSAWRDGLEVVDLRFDPRSVSYEKLVKTAASLKCASRVFAHNSKQLEIAQMVVGKQAVKASAKQQPRDAKPSDQKYYLRHSKFKDLPMTEFQATKINAAIKHKQPVEQWLSDRQKAAL